MIPATLILTPANNSRITVVVPTSATIVFTNFVLVSTLPNSLVPIASSPITFNGGGNTLVAGLNTSDPIAFQIDSQHDYYFMMWSTSVDNPSFHNLVANVNGTNNGVMPNGQYCGTVSGGVDSTNSNPISNSVYVAGSWVNSWFATVEP